MVGLEVFTGACAAAVTTSVCALVAESEPAALLAVTRTLIVCPTSAPDKV
jgi:hypothetical protein